VLTRSSRTPSPLQTDRGFPKAASHRWPTRPRRSLAAGVQQVVVIARDHNAAILHAAQDVEGDPSETLRRQARLPGRDLRNGRARVRVAIEANIVLLVSRISTFVDTPPAPAYPARWRVDGGLVRGDGEGKRSGKLTRWRQAGAMTKGVRPALSRTLLARRRCRANRTPYGSA
jgi:hypothetical protein